MRFTENGPSIPDELLNARDEGRVVFFCGAGVSRARAELPDFFGLAEAVIEELGVLEDHDACKVLNKARELGKELSIPGLISADRIFGLLERDFPVPLIESAAASALNPVPDADLSAHRVLLDLARTPQGVCRLVTTNFDRLFSDADADIPDILPHELPDLSRQGERELNGIVYLHGQATPEYDGAERSGFVLTTSDFGRAYLADGWTTKFVRDVISNFVVIFIGYSADDPPIHYLLEGLNKTDDALSRVYAFQAGKSNEAVSLWESKGVEAIPYSEDANHRALWETFEAWAARAKDPETWYGSVLDLAVKSPDSLRPFERGQVAHLVSTSDGVRRMLDHDVQPPAEWLCVFDRACRFAKPGRRHEGLGPEGPRFIPLSLYGLDTDSLPEKEELDDRHSDREFPDDAWDAFSANRIDIQDSTIECIPAFRGPRAAQVPGLPARLGRLSRWLALVAHQPAAVWWAARQEGLHPVIRQAIEWEFSRKGDSVPATIRNAWHYLFEAWDTQESVNRREWRELKEIIGQEGWNIRTLREYESVTRPRIRTSSSLNAGPIPPENDSELRLFDLLYCSVTCPVPHEGFPDIPDEHVADVIRILRQNVELAVQLEGEVGGFHLNKIAPLHKDDSPDIHHSRSDRRLSGIVLAFSALFDRLVDLDVLQARREFDAWPVNDDSAFCRLRFWAAAKPELKSAHAFAQVVMSLSDAVFWGSSHQRDLLICLSERWEDLSSRDQKRIEKRLLKGPAKWEGEDDSDYQRYRAWDVLNSVHWLKSHGCVFDDDVDTAITQLRESHPDWKPEYGDKAATSLEPRGGWVGTNTDHSQLLHMPIDSILSRATELSGRSDDNFCEMKDPFLGLSTDHPFRALKALIHAAGRSECPKWAWSTFLHHQARAEDDPRFSAAIAEQLCKCPTGALAAFLHSATSWFATASKAMASECPEAFINAVHKFTDVLDTHPEECGSAILDSGKNRDWVSEAINAPAGHIADSLFSDPGLDDVKEDDKLPSAWLASIERLLVLEGASRSYALAQCSLRLNWFYHVAPDWTKDNMLSVLAGDNQDDRSAFLSGFLWNADISQKNLYVLLKSDLMTLAKEIEPSQPGAIRPLAALLLRGWGTHDEETGERLVSDREFRELLLHSNSDFRSHVLWTLDRWANEEEAGDAKNKWVSLSVEFLRDVWPRQKAIMNSTMTNRLCDFIFSSKDRFPELSRICLPYLTRLDSRHHLDADLRSTDDSIVEKYPGHVLDVLWAVLPDDVHSWPFGIESVLNRLSKPELGLLSDRRLIELNRKWDSR